MIIQRNATDVDRPPLSKAAKIVDESGLSDGYSADFCRVGTARVEALVRVVKLDMPGYDPRVDYFLSDDIEKPGTKPLFLLSATSSAFVISNYLTDGKRLWHTIPHFHNKNIPSVAGSAYKVGNTNNFNWQMTHEDLRKIKEAVERYVRLYVGVVE